MNSQKTNTKEFLEHMYASQAALNNAKQLISKQDNPSDSDMHNYLVAIKQWDKAYLSYMIKNEQITNDKFEELSGSFASWYTEHYQKDPTPTKTNYAVSIAMQIATKRCDLKEFEKQHCDIIQEDMNQMFDRFVDLPDIDNTFIRD